jgi:hypothetical protein
MLRAIQVVFHGECGEGISAIFSPATVKEQ